MAEICESMLNQPLDAFSRRDADAGRAVCKRDDNLERIGDRITKIGMRVICAATGQLKELNTQRQDE